MNTWKIPRVVEVPDEKNYWRNKSTDGPALERLQSPCRDCAVTCGFYSDRALDLKKQALNVRREASKRWFCHNHTNRACAGNWNVQFPSNRQKGDGK